MSLLFCLIDLRCDNTCHSHTVNNNISKDSFTSIVNGTIHQKKTRTEVKIPIMNPNLKAICEKYNYNIPSVIDVLINRHIKQRLKEPSEKVPSLALKVPTKLTMKQKDRNKISPTEKSRLNTTTKAKW